MIWHPSAKPPYYWPVERENPLARGLVFCSWFGEGAGLRLGDVSGQGLHGVMTGFAPATTIVVSGGSGGNAVYNQEYTPSGSYGGKPKYVSADSNYWCVFDDMMSWAWVLMPADAMPWEAVASNNDSSAPTAGSWSAGFSVVAGDALPGPWFADGGGCLRFGGSDRVEVPDSALFDSGPLTVMARVRPTTLSSFQNILAKTQTLGTTEDFGLILQANGTWVFQTGVNGGWVGSLANGTWATIAGVTDGTDQYTYQDGQYLATTTGSHTYLSEAPFNIGCSQYPGSPTRHFVGDIAFVAVWARALTAAEVRLVTEQPAVLAVSQYRSISHLLGGGGGGDQVAEPGTAALEIEALGVSGSVEAAGQTAAAGTAELEIEAFGATGALYLQVARPGTAALEIEALGASGSQWDGTETVGETWLAVAEMADGTVWVGLRPDSAAPRPVLRRWRESSRERIHAQGERVLAELRGETWAVPLPASAAEVRRVHPAGWALAWQPSDDMEQEQPGGGILGQPWTWGRGPSGQGEYEIQPVAPIVGTWALWEYEGSNTWTQRAVCGGAWAQEMEIVVHQGEVWVVEQGRMAIGERAAYRLSGRTLVRLRWALWPRWLVQWAELGGRAAWYRGRWWGLGQDEEGQWGVCDHDGQRVRRQSPRELVASEQTAAVASSRERLEMLWNLPAGDEETPGNNWATWLSWRNQQGTAWTSRELLMTNLTAGKSGKTWATGRRWPISGSLQPYRVYLIYTVPVEGLRLESVELHAGASESAEALRLEAVTIWAIRSEQALRLEGVALHAGASESAEALRLEAVTLEAGASESEEALRLESMALYATGVVRRVLVEEAALYAHRQHILPEGWGIRFLVSHDTTLANAVRCVISSAGGELRGYVRSDLEHIDPRDLDSYEPLVIGPGAELGRWGETIRVALAKPEGTVVDGAQVVLRRE
jgi:hypothetical protein